MRFMLFVCAEPDLQLSPEDKAALPSEVEEWATAHGSRLRTRRASEDNSSSQR